MSAFDDNPLMVVVSFLLLSDGLYWRLSPCHLMVVVLLLSAVLVGPLTVVVLLLWLSVGLALTLMVVVLLL